MDNNNVEKSTLNTNLIYSFTFTFNKDNLPNKTGFVHFSLTEDTGVKIDTDIPSIAADFNIQQNSDIEIRSLATPLHRNTNTIQDTNNNINKSEQKTEVKQKTLDVNTSLNDLDKNDLNTNEQKKKEKKSKKTEKKIEVKQEPIKTQINESLIVGTANIDTVCKGNNQKQVEKIDEKPIEESKKTSNVNEQTNPGVKKNLEVSGPKINEKKQKKKLIEPPKKKIESSNRFSSIMDSNKENTTKKINETTSANLEKTNKSETDNTKKMKKEEKDEARALKATENIWDSVYNTVKQKYVSSSSSSSYFSDEEETKKANNTKILNDNNEIAGIIDALPLEDKVEVKINKEEKQFEDTLRVEMKKAKKMQEQLEQKKKESKKKFTIIEETKNIKDQSFMEEFNDNNEVEKKTISSNITAENNIDVIPAQSLLQKIPDSVINMSPKTINVSNAIISPPLSQNIAKASGSISTKNSNKKELQKEKIEPSKSIESKKDNIDKQNKKTENINNQKNKETIEKAMHLYSIYEDQNESSKKSISCATLSSKNDIDLTEGFDLDDIQPGSEDEQLGYDEANRDYVSTKLTNINNTSLPFITGFQTNEEINNQRNNSQGLQTKFANVQKPATTENNNSISVSVNSKNISTEAAIKANIKEKKVNISSSSSSSSDGSSSSSDSSDSEIDNARRKILSEAGKNIKKRIGLDESKFTPFLNKNLNISELSKDNCLEILKIKAINSVGHATSKCVGNEPIKKFDITNFKPNLRLDN